ncbi:MULTISPECIES: ABC transporter permease [unclassified Cupriavidus]|uniref:ABC transporter permease n=1 Tax=unclassified Cupriavidus TaxID=2640874 RepID=UPI002091B1F6|nr:MULTISPECIES: ABC transporter permease [unclassified Cupriavidus]MCO4861555.1 ABC transporter permease [Cupriavidus sp. WGlv3]MEC3764778.1 ABC transporter permease [Cupriavidus sp. SS-3]
MTVYNSSRKHPLTEYAAAAKLWRVWLHMGVQDVKGRFRNSVLGPLWILINLSATMAAVGIIFGKLFHQPMEEFLPFLTLGLAIWAFMTSALTEGGSAFVNAEGYIKQFSFPKVTYLYRAMVPYLVVFCVGMLVFFAVALAYGRKFDLGALWFLPGFLLFIVINFFHLVIVAHLGARFRDLPHLLSGLIQIGFYVTPVMYTVTMLKDRGLGFIYQYNPLYYLIEIVRYPLLNNASPPEEVWMVAVGYAVLIGIAAFAVMKRMSHRIVYVL